MVMHPLGIRLETADPPRLGPQIIGGLKDLLPFSRAVFRPCPRREELPALLVDIGMSPRQRERAEKRLLEGRGFWDRIKQKALLPLMTEQGRRCLGLYEFQGVPKDIVPGEASRTLQLLAAVIHDRLLLAKISKTISADDIPPAYVMDMKREDPGRQLNLVQLSFYKRTATLKQGMEILQQSLPACRIEPAGRSCSTLWFTVDCQDRNKFSEGLRQASLMFSRSGQKVKALIGHKSFEAVEEVEHLQQIARGLKTSVLAPAMLDEILEKTGADLGSPFFRPGRSGFKTGSCCAMIRLESLAALKRLRSFCRSLEPPCRVLDAGSKCLALHFKRPEFKKEGLSFQDWAQDLFEKVRSIAGAMTTAGFASTEQTHVSASFLPYASFLALLHASLLGRGNMAVFDHVTLNVHGDLLVSWGDVPGACAAYRRGLKLRPGDINLLNSLGVCLADMRRFKQAKACFRTVLSANPDNFMALYNLAGVNLDTGNLTDASKEAEKAYHMDPRNPAVLLRLVNCWIKQDKIAQVDSLLAEVSSRTELPFPLLRIFGRTKLETGQWQPAKKILTRCLDLKKNDPQCLALLARGYLVFENDEKTASKLLKEIPRQVFKCRELREITGQMEELMPAV